LNFSARLRKRRKISLADFEVFPNLSDIIFCSGFCSEDNARRKIYNVVLFFKYAQINNPKLNESSVFVNFNFSMFFSNVFAEETVGRFLRGRVIDADNSPIEKARVKIVSGSGPVSLCETNEEGRFACEANFDEGFTLTVEAGGFSILRQTFVKAQDFSAQTVFTLAPESLRETVQVTAKPHRNSSRRNTGEHRHIIRRRNQRVSRADH
jgi:hypothetical protein